MWVLEYQLDRAFWYIPIKPVSILHKSLFFAVFGTLCCNIFFSPTKIVEVLPVYNKPPLLILPDNKG